MKEINARMFTKSEEQVLLGMICDAQIQMLIEDNSSYQSEDYDILERLKVKVKNVC